MIGLGKLIAYVSGCRRSLGSKKIIRVSGLLIAPFAAEHWEIVRGVHVSREMKSMNQYNLRWLNIITSIIESTQHEIIIWV